MSNFDIEKLLNIYNYFDGIIITDEKGVITYYSNLRTDIYNLRIDQIIGKTILEIHPELSEEDSTIMQVLKTGKPIYDKVEKLTTPHGDSLTNICSTIPIFQNGKIAGAIDFSRGLNSENKNIERSGVQLKKGISSLGEYYTLNDIVSTSTKINGLKTMIPMIANTDSPVLIYGETGTGKEMFAESIYTSGTRASKTIISQNCAAIPSTLLESILFGTVKGSFTDAEDKPGLFELADGGILFLDEINSMDLSMQAKILKVIEEKKVRRIGGEKTISFDVKVISAVNKDPLECVRNGELRQDLFYRLSTVLIDIPPLRSRVADITVLTDYFIKENNKLMNKDVEGVSEEVMELFCKYEWPGNVRELKNVIEGAFNVITSDKIQMENLPQYFTAEYYKSRGEITLDFLEHGGSLSEKVEDYEKRLIIKALDSTKNVSEAANLLKISKQALNYKLLKYGLKR